MLFTKAEIRFQHQLIYALPIEEQYVTIIQMDNGGIIQLHKLIKIGNDYSDLILVATHYCKQGKMVKILPEIHEISINKTISILFHQHQTLLNITILNDKGVMLLNAKRP